jgi:carboxymethylenebutenolidase
MKRGFELDFLSLDPALALQDLLGAVDAAAVHGRVGVVGYCFGGLLTWRAACELTGVDAAVAYYGGGIAREVDRQPRCPVMMHFGERDAHIPMADVDRIKAAHDDVSVFVYPADHGFNCDQRASYDADSAKVARERTLAFFETHVG